ncbi:MAG TPA: fumarylacetoacetate hydrolase family protein [Pyrinomonadaceae bacterium]|nr:fumarylacetoacetate hydrolase family protein [Pyrinomonadaceae bacterium]
MKVCRFTHPTFSGSRYAVIEGSSVHSFSTAAFPFDKTAPESAGLSLDEVKLIAPVEPSKIVCVGRNYREHAAELGNKMPDEPLLFLKAPSSIIASGDRIELPAQSQQVEHEGELGVVIGRRARNLAEDEDALSYVFGYTCVNDVTARDLQRKDVQFTRGKSFDTFCPVGPWIIDDLDPANATVVTRVNGEVKQNGNTRDMAFSVAYLIRYISAIMTLYPGDLIATGTPAGVSRLKHGDMVEVEVSNIGTLHNPVYDTTVGS